MNAIRAFRTLDCARKVRIHYMLTTALDERLLQDLGQGRFERREFSKYVADAKDHLSLCDEERGLRASGVDGEAKLLVTFGKLGSRPPESVIEEFEALLGKLCECAIVRSASRAETGTAEPDIREAS